jgi:hypothetical protein
MKHFEATVQCPRCSHVFRVCVHGTDLMEQLRGKTITVACPWNNSKVAIPGSQFSEVEKCAEGKGTIVIRELPRR